MTRSHSLAQSGGYQRKYGLTPVSMSNVACPGISALGYTQPILQSPGDVVPFFWKREPASNRLATTGRLSTIPLSDDSHSLSYSPPWLTRKG